MNIINDNHLDNAQIQANMTAVHNILNGVTSVFASKEAKLAVAA